MQSDRILPLQPNYIGNVDLQLSPMELLLFRKSSNIYTGLRSAVLSLIGCGILWSRYSVMKGILPSFTGEEYIMARLLLRFTYENLSTV